MKEAGSERNRPLMFSLPLLPRSQVARGREGTFSEMPRRNARCKRAEDDHTQYYCRDDSFHDKTSCEIQCFMECHDTPFVRNGQEKAVLNSVLA